MLVATLDSIAGSGNDVRTLTIPFNYTLKIAQDNSGTYYNSPSATYTDADHATATDYDMADGQRIEKNTDIVILNYAEDIPVEGVTDSSNHNWVIYLLAAIAGLAAVGSGFCLWKKRNEFVEG